MWGGPGCSQKGFKGRVWLGLPSACPPGQLAPGAVCPEMAGVSRLFCRRRDHGETLTLIRMRCPGWDWWGAMGGSCWGVRRQLQLAWPQPAALQPLNMVAVPRGWGSPCSEGLQHPILWVGVLGTVPRQSLSPLGTVLQQGWCGTSVLLVGRVSNHVPGPLSTRQWDLKNAAWTLLCCGVTWRSWQHHADVEACSCDFSSPGSSQGRTGRMGKAL